MPLYESRCTACAATGTYFRKIDDRHDTPACAECGAPTKQRISAVRGFGDLEPYQSPIDGREVRGRRARRDDLERNNCREYEGLETEQKEAARIRAERQKRLDAKVEAELERTITDLDASNRLTRTGERSDQPYSADNVRTY